MTSWQLSNIFAPIQAYFRHSKKTQGNIWQPSHVFAADKTLRLTDDERAKIHKQLPQAEDGNYYIDAVFEGGGVKGTAFLGVLQCLNDAGIRLRKVAGTSAGAITAALIATGFDEHGEFKMAELEKRLSTLDYNDFLTQKASPFIFNGNPSDDLQNPLLMLLNLLLVRKKGQYSSNPFLKWLQEQISPDKGTFKFFEGNDQKFWYEQRELQVVISDVSQKAMRVLPKDLGKYGEYEELLKTFTVAEAVRLSMSIPFFFEPGKLGGSTIVDGGVLSNFPLWIYDAEENQLPNCPTFGFRLVDPPKNENIQTAVVLFKEMLSTMQAASDRHYVEKKGYNRVININLHELGELKVTATQFNLTNEHKDALYKLGYATTKDFLLNKWNWEAHLKARGYDVTQLQKQKVESIALKVQKSAPIAA